MTSTAPRARGEPLARIAVAAGLLHALLATILTIGRYHLAGDSPDYLTLARNLSDGAGFTRLGLPEVYRAPGYPYLVALVHSFAGDIELTGHLVALACGVAAVLATCWAGRICAPPATAGLAALLVAVNAYFVDASASALSETGNALFSVLALGLLLRALRAPQPGAMLHALAFGAAASAAYLWRSESALLLPAGLVPLVAVQRRPVRKAGAAALAVGAFALVAAPYWHHLREPMGGFSMGGSAVNLIWYQSDVEERPPETFDPRWARDPLDPLWPDRTNPARFSPLAYVIANPGELARRYAGNALTLAVPMCAVLFFGVGVPLFALGMRHAPAALDRWSAVAIGLSFLPMIALPFREATDRFLEPYVPQASMVMALGLIALLERPPRRLAGLAGRRGALLACVAVLAILPMVKFARHLGRDEEPWRARYRAAGAAIADRVEARGDCRPVVMATSSLAGLAAGGDTVEIPRTGDLAVLLAQMDRWRALWLVVAREPPGRRVLVAELDAPGSKPGLDLVASFPHGIDLYRRAGRPGPGSPGCDR